MDPTPTTGPSAGEPGIEPLERAATGPDLAGASTLAGRDIVNLAGQTLGEVEDVLLDVPRGRIAYIVMASGGFLGIGEKRFAIPWAALTLDNEHRRFVLDANKSLFERAPGFDKEAQWPTQLNGGEAYHRDLHAFYGTEAYWERR